MVSKHNKYVESNRLNALKTLSLRLRSTKADLESANEESDGAFETISKMQKTIKGLTGVDVLDKNGDYRATFDIIRDISKQWGNMTDLQKSATLEGLAGKTRAQMPIYRATCIIFVSKTSTT